MFPPIPGPTPLGSVKPPKTNTPPTVHTSTSLFIRAPRKRIFETVSQLTRWPEWLPHYREVRVLGSQPRPCISHGGVAAASRRRGAEPQSRDGSATSGACQIVRMAASRDGIPISWVSAYWADPETCELHFEHLRAWTKGMKVVWTLTPKADGTEVEILHDLRFRVPALAWLAEPIIGGFFIDNIAGKTLRTFKQQLEGPGPTPPLPD